MRRKSARTASKTADKTKVADPPVRQTRRTRRRKVSESASGSDASEEEVKPTENIQGNETITSEVSNEEVVWKVTKTESPSGEIQKLKISLSRTSPSTPERSTRRRRNKSSSQTEDESYVTEETSRRTRQHGSPIKVAEEVLEEKEEKKGKGKSKAKNKTKIENTPQVSEIELQKQYEISENVQVTPQSPSDTDKPVDTESIPEVENNDNEQTNKVEEDGNKVNDMIEAETNQMEVVEEVNKSCEPNKLVKLEIKSNDNDNSCPKEEKFSVVDVKTNNEEIKLEIKNEIDSVENKDVLKQTLKEELIAESVKQEDKFKVTQNMQKSEINIELKNEFVKDESKEIVKDECKTELGTTKSEEGVKNEGSTTPPVQVDSADTTSPAKEVPAETDEAQIVVMNSAQVEEIKVQDMPQIEKKITEDEPTSKRKKSSKLVLKRTKIDNDSVLEKVANCTPTDETKSTSIEQMKEDVPEKTTDDATTNEMDTPKLDKENDSAHTEAFYEEKMDISDGNILDTYQGKVDDFEDKLEVNQGDLVINQEQLEVNHEKLNITQEKLDITSEKMDFTPEKLNIIREKFEIKEDKASKCSDLIEMQSEIRKSPKRLKKKSQPIKLNRNFSTEDTEMDTKQQKPKPKWGTDFPNFDVIMPHIIQINYTTVKNICPDVELVDEKDLKLEIVEVKDRRVSIDRKSERKMSEASDSEHNNIIFDRQLSHTSSFKTDSETEDTTNIIAMNRKISIVDDSASKLRPPPSPAKHPTSPVLYITNLVRPFTLKQLRELLERTGKIIEEGFWTDRIKSKCYVHYETQDEAEATRNALHGVHWPIGNGKKLIIDYATPEDLETAKNPPPKPVELSAPEKENQEPAEKSEDKEDRRKEGHIREWDVGKEGMQVERAKSRSKEHVRIDKRRHSRHSPSPTDDFISRKQKKLEDAVPQKLMDDLFQKTKAMPSIYWQPLTPEEIATKQQQRLQRMAEHKRRMEETSRSRNDFGRGGVNRRRYD